MAEQNLHHFISNSSWSARAVIQQVQAEIAATPGLEWGGVLVLDESANAKTGGKRAGSGRQYNERLRKVGMSQVGTFPAYTNGSVWTWVDGELYLLEDCFTAEKAELREETRRSCRAEVQDEDRTRLGDDPAGACKRSSLRGNLLR